MTIQNDDPRSLAAEALQDRSPEAVQRRQSALDFAVRYHTNLVNGTDDEVVGTATAFDAFLRGDSTVTRAFGGKVVRTIQT